MSEAGEAVTVIVPLGYLVSKVVSVLEYTPILKLKEVKVEVG